VKLFYARDFRALMLKFGRLGLVDGLTGTSGQMVPDRTAEAAADVAGDWHHDGDRSPGSGRRPDDAE
jgi:hypothetical protein